MLKWILATFMFSLSYFVLNVNTVSPDPINQSYSGNFVLVGGGEIPEEASQEFLRLAGGSSSSILIMPQGSNLPTANYYWLNYWRKRSSGKLTLDTNKINTCTGIWFGGGDQKKLSITCTQMDLSDKIKSLLRRNGVVGGTSAGASIVSAIMPYGNSEYQGLSLLPDLIIDQHFSQRRRQSRLRCLLEVHPDRDGLGIDEGTAVVINNHNIRVIGGGKVTLLHNRKYFLHD